jgi:hypothetical protein
MYKEILGLGLFVQTSPYELGLYKRSIDKITYILFQYEKQFHL